MQTLPCLPSSLRKGCYYISSHTNLALSTLFVAYEKAYSIRLECLGEDDEETVESKKSLETLKEKVGITNWYLMVRS